MTGLDAPSQLLADLCAHLRPRRRDLEQGTGEVGRITPREAEPERQATEELVQGGVAREHRHAGRSRLVDDLVEGLAPVAAGSR